MSDDLSFLGLTTAEDVNGVMPTAYYPGTDSEGTMYEGCLGFVAGPSGASKSLFSDALAKYWTATRGHVIKMDGEDGGSQGGMSRFRLEAAGVDMSRVHFAEFSIPGDVERLRAAIDHLQSDGSKCLVIWDTADTWIEAPVQRWGKALHNLAYNVLPQTGATGILVHHTLKNVKKGADWKAAVGGATAGLVGKSRFGFLYGIRPDDSDQRVLITVKDSYRPTVVNGSHHALAYEFDEEDVDDGSGNLRPVSFIRLAEKAVAISDPVHCVFLGGDNNSRGPTPEKAAAAAEWLCTQLADGARPVSDVSRCMTHPDGNPKMLGECGWMSYAKIGDGSCPYCRGPIKLEQGLKETAELDGISWGGAARKALAALGCENARKGSRTADSGLVFSWRLPDGHPAANETDSTYRKELA
jgi:hypothetical protein